MSGPVHRPLDADDLTWDPPDVLPDNGADAPMMAARAARPTGVTLDDFYAHMPTHSYIFVPSRDLWPASSVDGRVPWVTGNGQDKPMRPSAWLDRHRPIEQMTWVPGEPLVIRDRLVSEGGWIARPGCSCINLYRPPALASGDPRQATRWLEHVHTVYPDEADHLVRWLAHRVQRPQEKINHCLVLGGLQGIGKDTILEPVKAAIGPWNFVEVAPTHLLGRFNGFLKSVILRVNEARDLGDIDRFAFYDHLKAYTAAPPDVLRIDEKNLREYAIWNVTGIVVTSNHKTDGLYLPADDRRHYVAWSTRTKDDFTPAYWTALYRWYGAGGVRHVAAYLAALDLGAFDPKAPPAKTDAFWDICNANRAPEDAELADILEALHQPEVTTIAMVAEQAQLKAATADFATWLRDRRNARQVPYRFEAAGYVPVRNAAAKDGLWVVEGRRAVIYGRQELALRDRLKHAKDQAASSRE